MNRSGEVITAGVHAEGLTKDKAHVVLMQAYLKYGSTLDAVIVRLDNGVDINGERHVVARIGHGRPWWE